MVYSTTMIGLSVVGSDISRELLMSRMALQNGWDLTIIDPSNTSFVIGLLVPFLTWALHIGAEWVYKVVLPMIYALTPVILYLVFRKMIGDLKAFYASMFFIMMPVFSLEIPTIGKSMVAEPLMASTLWVMFTDWKLRWKFPAVLVLVLLVIWAHYTIGLLFTGFFIVILVAGIVAKLIPKWRLFKGWAFPSWAVLTVIVVALGSFVIYYSKVGSGLLTYYVGEIGGYYANPAAITSNDVMTHTINSSQLLQAGTGLDFFSVGWSGKLFRIVQYFTQFLVVAGCAWIIFKYNIAKNGVRLYRFPPEFIACMGGGLAILGACVCIPYFGSLINPTRYYHVALFFLAPCFIVAFDAIVYLFKKKVLE